MTTQIKRFFDDYSRHFRMNGGSIKSIKYGVSLKRNIRNDRKGDHVSEFDKICEVQSDKASVEITSRYTGIVKELFYKIGDMAKVGSKIVDIETENINETIDSTVGNVSDGKLYMLAAPAVRRIVREHNIDIKSIKGTGKDGRVTKEDVLNHVADLKIADIQKPYVSQYPVEDKIVPLTNIQKSMFKIMTKSLQIPHFGYSDEYSFDNVISFRDMIGQSNNQFSIKKISYMPILIKSFSVALQQFPILNASIIEKENDDGDSNVIKIRYRSAHNVGIAMDTPGGLLVPNIKNVQTKSIFEISEDLQRLQEAGKKNLISPTDLKDGTITLSNIGIIGGIFLSPVVVCSELCIAAIGKIQRLPRFEIIKDKITGEIKEQVVAKNIVPISFSADHRVIDGVTIAKFSQRWKNLLENPALLSAELR
ncbi:9976_t:CDS:2 [Diversispora eburnea]|uniref:Dihydrolipoamide acetyltransferase component of pyruvate dehydrogenase complex n=1 Tax=Diversispora eburnea TaxID=1213867 RepID=A0A9N8WMH3_9GLOM|nr:9976_t:CDS:2 [Diversispora eburnea]